MPFTLLCIALYAFLPAVGWLVLRMIDRGLRKWFKPVECLAIVGTFALLATTALVVLATKGDPFPLLAGIPFLIGGGAYLARHLRREPVETSRREPRRRSH